MFAKSNEKAIRKLSLKIGDIAFNYNYGLMLTVLILEDKCMKFLGNYTLYYSYSHNTSRQQSQSSSIMYLNLI